MVRVDRSCEAPNPLPRFLPPTLVHRLRALIGRPRELTIYCDGSSHDVANRPGGWAFVVVEDDEILLEQSGASPATSNTTMELQAALAALNAVLERGWHRDAALTLVSDSRGTLDMASGVAPLPVHDHAIASELRTACARAGATTRWVRGHSGDRWNEYVDSLAAAAKQTLVPKRVQKKAARRKQARSLKPT